MSSSNEVNFYDLPTLPQEDEQFTDLLGVDGVRIERIVSSGQSSPPGFWYDQDQHEWFMVVQGKAVITVQTETGEVTRTLRAGDHSFIPAHQKHRVAATCKEPPTLWLAVFIDPR